mmetsp:Transcript_7077/g.13038  ORF Transcript_7077/g.13038 Transcript_7077/m.13038 type:complete len:184 (+) Transcript_7077:78-629(+)
MVAKTMDDTTTYVDIKFQEVLGKNATKAREYVSWSWLKIREEPFLMQIAIACTVLTAGCGAGCFFVLLCLIGSFFFIWASVVTAAILLVGSWITLVGTGIGCLIGFFALPVAGLLLLIVGFWMGSLLALVFGFRNRKTICETSRSILSKVLEKAKFGSKNRTKKQVPNVKKKIVVKREEGKTA